MSSFQEALDYIRKNSSTPHEKGIKFEKLIKIYLENDPIQKQQFTKVWTYQEWASKFRPNLGIKDIGIDLVAKISNDSLIKGGGAILCNSM